MDYATLLATLRSDEDLSEILARTFDFQLLPDPQDTWYDELVQPCTDQPFTVIATDAAGGVYALCGESSDRPLLHVTSEGQAGIVGETLGQFLSILVALPKWHDLLHFSGDGNLGEMRRAQLRAHRQLVEEEAEIRPDQALLTRRLSLVTLSDPVATLHANVATLTPRLVTLNPESGGYESLFNSFVVKDGT